MLSHPVFKNVNTNCMLELLEELEKDNDVWQDWSYNESDSNQYVIEISLFF